MIHLPNGCKRSKIYVYPPNWMTKEASIEKDWFLEYRFHDPAYKEIYPKGKPIRIKAGINTLKKVSERRGEMKLFIKHVEKELSNGYNPILEKTVVQVSEGILDPSVALKDVNPESPFIKSLRYALEKSTCVEDTKKDINSVLNSIEKAAIFLEFNNLPISQIQVKHIKLCLDYCVEQHNRFGNKRFNKAKAYLSGLFKYLLQVGAASGNAPRDVLPLPEIHSERRVLSDENIKRIKEHLWNYNRPFYNFMMMFYYSGGRIKELMRLKVRDVDLVNQTYKCLILKGKKRYVLRTIRNIAVPFWKEQIANAPADYYVFSKELLPGPEMISSRQVTIRWRRHVKKPLGIDEDFYSLKHINTDRTLEALGAKAAAGQAGHTSTKMAEEIYAFNESKRIHNELKGLDIDL